MLLARPTAAPMSGPRDIRRDTTQPLQQARLWIDGVGCWLLWLPESLTIGGPQPLDRSLTIADLPLLADLKRRHATILRSGDSYHLISHGHASLGNGAHSASAPGQAPQLSEESRLELRSGIEFTLGRDVRWQFVIPTPLSNSARLVCTSGHRPAERIDGVILLEQLCQLGPHPDHHIHCPRADTSLILYRKGGQLWCRSPQQWTLNGQPVTGSALLADGAVAATETLSFRLEVN